MKLPNGYGSVHKLSGKRRNPWRARKTVGFVWCDKVSGDEYDVLPDGADVLNYTAKQKYATIGYYKTRNDALQALAEYNSDPYDLSVSGVTFSEVYERWLEEHAQKVSKSNITGVKASYKLCVPVYDMRLSEIKLAHLQKIVDDSGKNYPTLKKLKIMLGLMFEYGVKHEIVKPDKRDMISYLDIDKGNPNALDREPFSRDEIEKLWKYKDNPDVQIILIMIYTGVRISELLNLLSEDVHMDEKYFVVQASKTEAGKRLVPISNRIIPFFDFLLLKSEKTLTGTQKTLSYDAYYRHHWMPVMKDLNMNHKPHDTRHTCVSLLTSAGVDERIIKKIVGHKGNGVTEQVYTHVDLPDKLIAINKI